jgi:hypothetical protein
MIGHSSRPMVAMKVAEIVAVMKNSAQLTEPMA